MSRVRILIVDDEVGSSRLLKRNLELTGRFEVRVENRPREAVAAARQFSPHLAMVDVIMPDLTGPGLVAALEADPELKVIRIVFLTAAAPPLMPEEIAETLEGRVVITKPVSMEEIISVIERNLPQPETPDPSAGGSALAVPT
jgi:CheY-like chemotaxis protein